MRQSKGVKIMGKPKMIGMMKPFVPNSKRNTFKKKGKKK